MTGSAVVDAGICCDMPGTKGIEVDPEARTGRGRADVGRVRRRHPGARAGGDLRAGVGHRHRRADARERLGWLERKFGDVCDNLIRAEVVTADGRQVVASDDENPDLFWALRGGGGNFGVVTAFHQRLHPVGPLLLAGMLIWPAAMGGDLVRFYRDFMSGAPDEVGGALAFITAPPAPSASPASRPSRPPGTPATSSA